MEKVIKNEEVVSIKNKLPESFFKYLEENSVDIEAVYNDETLKNLPRYVRINPRRNVNIDDINQELGIELKPIEWIPNVYSLPSDIKISQLTAYKEGNLYGIDLSSCAVVFSLDPLSDDHVLDMCCSPGSKLCYIADIMRSKDPNGKGTLTGVDINEHRLNICRNLVKKYNHNDLISLYCEDGTTFSKIPNNSNGYDKVLVDAECTHDGSIKHLLKFQDESTIKSKKIEKVMPDQIAQPISNKERKRREKQKLEHLERMEKKKIKLNNTWTIENFEERVMNEEKLNNIVSLQKKLLVNAYHLTKVNGIIVYSTCSFTRSQNEDVVSYVLDQNEETKGKLVLIDPFPEDILAKMPVTPGYLEKTIRFDPKTSKSGGMFIAKLRKIK